LAVTSSALLLSAPAHALFEDEEARKAIIELRERVNAQQNALKQVQGEAVTGASLLELSKQNTALQRELAQLRGRNEELVQLIDQLTRRVDGLNERLTKLEPMTVVVDGAEIVVQPGERRDYDAAMAVLRQGDYAKAEGALEAFLVRHPDSGYRASVLFWLGNAQYANQQFKPAQASFSTLIAQFPSNARVPESKLALANCQLELKDIKGAKATLKALTETHPDSEAAVTAQQRLQALR
jgi:tol-pal system protein YbgF